MDYGELHELVHTDPEQAWPEVLAFVRRHRDLQAVDLIEDLVYEHDEQFIQRIEAAARDDPDFRSVVEEAYVGGVATRGAELFWQLQERLRAEAGS